MENETMNAPVNSGTVIITTEEYDDYKKTERDLEALRGKFAALEKKRLPKTVIKVDYDFIIYTTVDAVKEIGKRLKNTQASLERKESANNEKREKIRELTEKVKDTGMLWGQIRKIPYRMKERSKRNVRESIDTLERKLCYPEDRIEEKEEILKRLKEIFS